MGDPHIVLIVLAAPGSYARKGQRIRLDAVSDPTPKVSRILQQVMYFEDREFVLRSGPLENVRPRAVEKSCGRGRALAELHR
jgi:hypothetical protein